MKSILRALGLVFGDIGTSPIYTLTVIILLIKPEPTHIIGIISLIVWSFIIIVTIEYAWLAMSLGRRGEGGTIVLKERLIPLLRNGKQIAFFTMLTYIGVAALIGDGVITPAISILSAVEGILLIPGMEDTGTIVLVVIAAIIAIFLFAFQKKGSEKVSDLFGPIMIFWFLALAVAGIFSIMKFPQILQAVNPYYGSYFLVTHGWAAFFILSDVLLCLTGAEAMYADMGHLGRKPIVQAWYLVFFCLVLNYLGQGAFVLSHHHVKNVLFEMVFNQTQFFYIPFLVLSIVATVIASQAMISGIFSIFYQAITTHILPILKVDYTSMKMRTQIYINTVNWLLLMAVLFVMFQFRESYRLAAAYGFLVITTMSITGIMMTTIFFIRRSYFKLFFAVLVTIVDFAFLGASFNKIPHGGYLSLIIAAIPLSMILLYTSGQRKLYGAMQPVELRLFLEKYNELYHSVSKIQGTALFLVSNVKKIPPYMYNTMFNHRILYEDNIVFSIIRNSDPFGVTGRFKEPLADGLR
ncbi:MAG: KUP/HAK/KT family potassium transporter, partial [Candidatus Margulisiibacteriota bacterium]